VRHLAKGEHPAAGRRATKCRSASSPGESRETFAGHKKSSATDCARGHLRWQNFRRADYAFVHRSR
jgi:hypothetical protein